MTEESSRTPGASSKRTRLGFGIRLLAGGMRYLPTEIRRVEMFWRYLYQEIRGGGFAPSDDVDSLWPEGLQEPIRGRFNKKLVRLNLRDWAERRAYFTGRYYQKDLEALFSRLLAPGDFYIDIGANIGFTLLNAAFLIGPRGRIFAFEPNPHVFPRLEEHVRLNDLRNVELIQAALGSAEAKMNLHVDGAETGTASLVAPPRGNRTGTMSVQVLRGDDVLRDCDAHGPMVIKIDVEGHEYDVLSGLSTLLQRKDIALVVEVTDFLLRKVGASARELHGLLEEHGFEPVLFRLEQGRWGRVLRLKKLRGALELEQYDALFLKSDSDLMQNRIESCLEK